MKGHCRHCTDACKATRILSGNPSIIHANGDGVRWGSGQCPACAEAERIAAECERRALMESACGDERGLLIAAAIARGET